MVRTGFSGEALDVAGVDGERVAAETWDGGVGLYRGLWRDGGRAAGA